MKKNSKFNFSLLKLMELSNFPTINTDLLKNKDLKYLNSFTKIKYSHNSFSFSILDLLPLVKSLKQYIRVVRFLSLKYKKKIYIVSEFNNFFFIKLLLNKLCLTKYIFLQPEKQETVNFVKLKHDPSYSNFLISLNLSLNSNKNNLSKLTSNNLFLITEINSNIKLKSDSFYKIFNEVSDFKKIIFLLLFLEKHFKL